LDGVFYTSSGNVHTMEMNHLEDKIYIHSCNKPILIVPRCK